MTAIFTWIALNWATIATVLLGISEALALVFPASTGFGGILAGIINFIKSLGVKTAAKPEAKI